MFHKKWLRQYALVFAAVMLSGIAVLYAAGLLPQERVYANLQRSAVQFELEGQSPYLLHAQNDAYRLDAFSESLILNHSYHMDTRTSPASIFRNPSYRDGWHPVSSLLRLTQDDQITPNSNRSHYWLGCRAVVRALLCLMPYQDIRGVVCLLFFTLFTAAALSLQKKGGSLVAVCFALTVLAFNPVVVSTSLQFSCCFLIAFAGVIGVCFTQHKPRALWLVFLLLGQLTQYLDFYTSPLITWGVPFVALIAIRRARGALSLREALQLMLISLMMWGVSYGCMWMLRLILVTCFTEINALSVLTNQLLYYTGITEVAPGQLSFSAWGALAVCLKNVFTPANLVALVFAAAALGIRWITLRKKGGLQPANASLWIYALAGALAPMWLMCARQASGRHAYFQYRTLTVLVFAVFCFFAQLLEPRGSDIKE